MKKWTNRLMTIAGVVLILVAAYLFAKPHIDNYLHYKDKDEKIEQYDKNVKEQASKDKKQQAKPLIPKINRKWQAILKFQMLILKNQYIQDQQHLNN